MKRRNFILILLSFVSLMCQAQEDAKKNPGWVWEISGKGLAQKSYLFGTCHGDGHSFTRAEIFSIGGLDKAMGNVGTVLFETDMNPQVLSKEDKNEVMKLMKWIRNPGPEYMMPEGVYYKPLFDSIAHFNEVNRFLTFEMKDVEYWKKTPGYWCARLQLYLFGKTRSNIVTVDSYMYQEARRRGYETGGLETGTDVMGKLMPLIQNTTAIDTMSMKKQVNTIYDLIQYLKNDSVYSTQEFTDAYLANDTCIFQENIKANVEQKDVPEALGYSSEKSEYVNNQLLNERNQAWMPVILENIRKKPCMIAVGCRHLLDYYGLIAMLRKEGYTVEPIIE